MLDEESILAELNFKAVRSSGSGGQHVNKVASKVELQFNIPTSTILSEEQKSQLLENLKSKISKEGTLTIQCGETRSQHKNKAIVINRFFGLLNDALKVEIERKPTKTPKHVKIKRLKKKRQHSEKKANRKPPELP